MAALSLPARAGESFSSLVFAHLLFSGMFWSTLSVCCEQGARADTTTAISPHSWVWPALRSFRREKEKEAVSGLPKWDGPVRKWLP